MALYCLLFTAFLNKINIATKHKNNNFLIQEMKSHIPLTIKKTNYITYADIEKNLPKYKIRTNIKNNSKIASQIKANLQNCLQKNDHLLLKNQTLILKIQMDKTSNLINIVNLNQSTVSSYLYKIIGKCLSHSNISNIKDFLLRIDT